MAFDVDKEIQNAVQAMNDAEDALVQSGFSEDQWMLIKSYVLSAILHNQLAVAKAWQNVPEIDTRL